jgi:hypothetical protein
VPCSRATRFIDRDFDSFSDREQETLLSAIKDLLGWLQSRRVRCVGRGEVHQHVGGTGQGFSQTRDDDNSLCGQAQHLAGITPGLAAGDGPGQLQVIAGQDCPGDSTPGPAAHPSHATPDRHISPFLDRLILSSSHV